MWRESPSSKFYKARLRFLTAAEGGRQRPIRFSPYSYRPIFNFGDGNLWDGAFKDAPPVIEPGAEVDVEFQLLHGLELPFCAGDTFNVQEGHHLVASGKIVETGMGPRIRQARPEEAAGLTELTMRSKAHWGYDAAFMADARADLEVVPARFQPDFHVYILETEKEIIGFCSLCPVEIRTVELTHLFIDPQHIGCGYGKRLWNHAVLVAQCEGYRRIILSSDPFAELFYASRGAVRIGMKESTVRAGRMLPLMEYILKPAESGASA